MTLPGHGEVLISPFTDEDYGEFERWVQDSYFEIAARNVDRVPKLMQREFMHDVWQTVCNITITDPRALRLMATLDGASRVLWISIRRRHPAVQLHEVRDAITDDKLRRMAMAKFDSLNGGLEKKEEAVAEKEPTSTTAISTEP